MAPDARAMDAPAEASVPDPRRSRLLDAAVATFVRFGFRKTSMEEVARAAGLSRQGLYLHFSTKEDLFKAALRHALASGLAGAAACVEGDGTLEERLTGAFDAWIGRYVGSFGADVTDIEEASNELVGPVIGEHEELFIEMVAKTLRTSGLAAAYKPVAISARQLAETLYATGRGLKHVCRSRSEFTDRMAICVRALGLPLRGKGAS
jgi:TetR/AcrR family transcriptional regulator, regulator of autoinduction and epiphytic fitness